MTNSSDQNISFDKLLGSVNEDVYEQFRQAVAIGRWENGEQLSQAQKELCLQAIIAYEAKNLPEEQRLDFVVNSGTGCNKQRNKT